MVNYIYLMKPSYDTVKLSEVLAENVLNLNQGQREVYDEITDSIVSNTRQLLFPDTPGGIRIFNKFDIGQGEEC